MSVFREINKELDNGNYTVAIYLNMQKALDKVDHRKVFMFYEELEIRRAESNLIKIT